MRLMRAGGPDLLAVDDPLVALHLRPGHRAGDVGSAAGFGEQLAPGILPGHDAEQELLFVHVGAMRQDRGGRQDADAGLGDADGADTLEFFLDHRHQADGQVAAIPAARPVRVAPAGLGQLMAPFHQTQVRVPVCFQPGAAFGADGGFVEFGHVAISLQAAQFRIITSRW